jgi:hypothetical protein
MAEVTLRDYAGFILTELIQAREMADRYSRSVAERYAQDPVMRHFSVPRFKLPKIDLTIPILVSGARFSEAVRLDLPEGEFDSFVANRVAEVTLAVERARTNGFPEAGPPRESPAIGRLTRDFYGELMTNPQPRLPDPVVTRAWAEIFRTCLAERGLLEFYADWDPRRDLLTRTTRDVVDMVRQHTVVEQTLIESLLVDPETNVVKNGSSPTSVFTVNAELLEEGVFFRSVKDPDTGQSHTVVEFE